jgi:hypothetical protein
MCMIEGVAGLKLVWEAIGDLFECPTEIVGV